MKKILAIIESPFQAICLAEFISSHFNEDISSRLVIIFNERSKVSVSNIEQCINTIRYLDIDPLLTICININGNLSGLLRKSLSIRRKIKQLKEFDFEYLIAGEFRSSFVPCCYNAISFEKCVFLDDGNAIKKLVSERYTIKSSSLKNKVICSLLFIIGLNVRKVKEAVFFSCFLSEEDLKGSDTFIRNDFKKINSAIKEKSSSSMLRGGVGGVGGVGIIGSPLSEAGVCSYSSEKKLLSDLIYRVRGNENAKDYKIVYFPHRRDSDAKKKWLLDNFKEIEIDATPLPIEIKFLKFGIVDVYGFYSTCFETLPVIYPDVRIRSFVIPKNFLHSAWLEFVCKQYTDYKLNKNISFLNLNN